MSLVAPGEGQEACGVPVEAVYHPGAGNPAHSWPVGDRPEQRVDAASAPPSGGGMSRHARRLHDHHQVLVEMDDR